MLPRASARLARNSAVAAPAPLFKSANPEWPWLPASSRLKRPVTFPRRPARCRARSNSLKAPPPALG
eukprot:8737317-Lingulodinium_polyedra.AAC.1